MKKIYQQSRLIRYFLIFLFFLSCFFASSVLYATLAPLADFNGDGKTDICVAHKSSSTITKISIRCSNTGFLDELHDGIIADFGNEGDKYYCGDFDGNGKTDLALCRRSSANQYKWSVRYSTTGMLNRDSGFTVADYGNDGDFFVVGDWNGDGMDDIGLCRPESPTAYKWSFCYSGADGILDDCHNWVLTHGRDGDRFYVGDFNGDGRSDLLLARMSDPYRIRWSVCYSYTGLPTIWGGWVVNDFGNAYDEFYMGDFDGNGKSDLAIARQISPYDMTWGVRYSTTGVLNKWSGWIAWTSVGNDFMVSDYDGDGVHDMTVNYYTSATSVKWGVYETTDNFMDAWRGWQVASFGEQEDRLFPGDCLRNTIDQFGVREIGVSAAYSPTVVDYYCHGTFLPAASDPWCSEFVSWCYHRAGNSFTDGTVDPSAPWLLHGNNLIQNWFEDNAFWWDNSPTLPVTLKPGDYIRSQNSSGDKHSRMVERVIGNKLYTVEGNATSRVRKKTLTNYLTNTNVLGFGRLYDVDREDWQVCASGTTLYLKSVAFQTSTTGVAVGYDGIIMRSTNGGSNWTKISNPASTSTPTLNLYDVTWNGSAYVAVGESGTIIRSTDSGRTWIAKTSGTTKHLFAVAFYDNLKGIAAGVSGKVLYTANGGSTWNSGASPITSTIQCVCWINDTDAFAVGSGGSMIKSTDSGDNWSAITSGTTRILRGVAFGSSTDGWVVGDRGTIMYTDDGGDTWETQISGTTEMLCDIDIKGSNDAHAVGNNGTILHTEDGMTWEKQISGENEFLDSVWIYSYDEIWAVGRDGIILKADNGGDPHE
jgi:photosystem II stability/assembly factor-like uncharacterized protein